MTETESTSIRLLLSGGGHRAMLGSVGVMLQLMVTGEWNHVREIISVSGGSAPNAALLTVGDSAMTDAERLRHFYDRLLADRARPWATWRRVPIALGLLALAVGVVCGVLAAGGLLPGTGRMRPWVAIFTGIVAVPVLLQVGRRIASAYLRDSLQSTTSSRHRELAEFDGQPRQHVFCASGLASGTPYYFWVGGDSFLRGEWEGDGSDEGDGPRRWGSAIDSRCVQPGRGRRRYTVGDAVFASSSLPLFGGVMSPSNSEASGSGLYLLDPEPLIDGGVSGVFGQQVSAPLAWRAHRGVRRQAATAPPPPNVIAVDAFRHLSAPAPGILSIAAGFVRDRLSVISLLIGWITVSSEALYVNDLEDAEGVTLVRLCAPDLPTTSEEPSIANWELAWDDLRQRRSKQHALAVAEPATRPIVDRLKDLRAEVSRLGLLNLTSRRAVNAVTTGIVAAYVSRRPEVDESELRALLDQAGTLLFDGDERSSSFRLRWDETLVTERRRSVC